ncbi:ICP0-binding domain of ubiquitin-specific protease 7-domain-containing protein [Jimgerdemannia flammicorona]|uniref:ICP0-binding domain of ubiquitin-specific protease 7-domain-containing protein n=1 Tax=Jimgerdemannia flammicorona TaxID=994334 RepID=A0A433D5Q8_9FUNG|nr:ICP0-binding domain of ubiquitin-specific protease 7-domain-containing protein [Jimgerdemannia flammicorona]
MCDHLLQIITDETFKVHQGFDLAIFDDRTMPSQIPSFLVKKKEPFVVFKQSVANHFQLPVNRFRLWIMVDRQNRTVRPDQPILEAEANLSMEIIQNKPRAYQSTLRLYLEVVDKPIDSKLWPPEGTFTSPYLMVFIKYFDPKTQTIEGCGKLYVQPNEKVCDIIPILNKKKGFPWNTVLKLFEEIQPSMIEAMKTSATFQQSEIQDGDIICFQKEMSVTETAEYRSQGHAATIIEFFKKIKTKIMG